MLCELHSLIADVVAIYTDNIKSSCQNHQFIVNSSNMDGTNWFKGNRLDLLLAQASPNCPEVSRHKLPDLKQW